MTRALLALLCLAAAPAAAWDRITDQGAFLGAVEGRELSYPGARLQVTPGGQITGSGLGTPVTGQWRWEDGFFCRTLFWGARDLGANCQMVEASGDRLRFTSDRGAGQSAAFRLR